MICVIDQIKYDTDKMELVSDKIQHEYKVSFLSHSYYFDGKNVRLWRSHKGRWLMTYDSDRNGYAVPMTENQATVSASNVTEKGTVVTAKLESLNPKTIKASAEVTISKVTEIKGYYRYYKLQESSMPAPSKPTSNPPSGWTDSEPVYVSGSTNTLYFVDCTVYSDDSFVFSAVSKSSSYEAAKDAWNKANDAQDSVDNIEIGGRNLKINSNFYKGIAEWKTSGSGVTLTSIADSIYSYCGKIVFSTNYANQRLYTTDYANRYNLSNITYTLSFMAKSTESLTVEVYRNSTSQK